MNAIAVAEFEKKEMTAIERVRSWVVATDEDFKALDAYLVGLKELEKSIIADFKDAKDKAFAAHRAICAQEKAHLDKIEEARRIGKPKLLAYEETKEAIRKAEQERLEAEARKKAEDEALARAAAAEKAGDTETAKAIISEPISVEPVKAQVMSPKRSTTIQTRWGAVIEDVNLIPREYLIPDMTALNRVAQATKGAIKIPGVKFESRKV